MKFEDAETNAADLETNPSYALKLIVKNLCGNDFDCQLSEKDSKLLSLLLENAKENGLSCSQFNELLLLLNQDKVGDDFFRFFFGNDIISLKDLAKGIGKYRGYAMLCFGNFEFAYRRLSQLSMKELENQLDPYYKETSNLQNEFEHRPKKMLEIGKIPRSQTWCLGVISGPKITVEAQALEREIKAVKKKSRFTKQELLQFNNSLVKMSNIVKDAQKRALTNTDIYLIWDFMDVYVATSMRNRWEYEETYDFLNRVFSDPRLKKLNIRHFDPTQSICTHLRDKGLLKV